MVLSASYNMGSIGIKFVSNDVTNYKWIFKASADEAKELSLIICVLVDKVLKLNFENPAYIYIGRFFFGTY